MSTREATQTGPTYFFDDLFEDWDARDDEPAPTRTSFPPAATFVAILVLLLLVGISTLIAIGVIASPAPRSAAGSAPTTASTSAPTVANGAASNPSSIATEADSAALLSSTGIETTVADLWTRSGQKGTVACPTVFSTEPGTMVTCSGVLEGNPLDFTVSIAAPSAGHVPFTFASWTSPRKL